MDWASGGKSKGWPQPLTSQIRVLTPQPSWIWKPAIALGRLSLLPRAPSQQNTWAPSS